MKVVNWAVDPTGALPPMPPPLPMGLDDDGDAVAEHDLLESAYFQYRERSQLTRWRMDMKEASDLLAPATGRQVLVGIAVVSALLVWRLDSGRS